MLLSSDTTYLLHVQVTIIVRMEMLMNVLFMFAHSMTAPSNVGLNLMRSIFCVIHPKFIHFQMDTHQLLMSLDPIDLAPFTLCS